MSRCVLNFANEAGWYRAGQERLRQSLAKVGYTGETRFYQHESQLGCPAHQIIPYGFKVAAINMALQSGFTSVLWCDAAVYAIKPLDPVFEHIERHGHLFFKNDDWNCAQWTSDACLEAMKVTRDAAEAMPQYVGTCFGLDLSNSRSAEFMQRMTGYAGVCFPGSWSNEARQVSSDPRVRGHRHDQSVGSILANLLGMPLTGGADTFFDYSDRPMKECIVLVARGVVP